MASLVTIAPGRAQTAGSSTLPAGSPVVFVLDDSLPVNNLRRGATFRVHLRDALSVGGVTAVAAGAADRIRVVDVTKPPGPARPEVTLELDSLQVGTIGRLPLALNAPTIEDSLPSGQIINAKTLATLGADREGVISMHIPSPFVLSADPPHADYTPIPLQTASGFGVPKRSPSPTPSPSPTGLPSPAHT